MKPMERVLAVSTLLVVVVAATLGAQSAAKKYVPEEIEQLKLENLQKAALLKSVEVQRANDAFARAMGDLNEQAQKVKVAHKWPDAVKFDVRDVTYCDNMQQDGTCPAADAPAPEKK